MAVSTLETHLDSVVLLLGSLELGLVGTLNVLEGLLDELVVGLLLVLEDLLLLLLGSLVEEAHRAGCSCSVAVRVARVDEKGGEE